MNDRTQRRVVCAAIRKGDTLICGARHFDQTMHQQIERMHFNDPRFMRDAEQGFVDQWGEFMTREEAYMVARERGQFLADPIHKTALFSEDLY